VDPLAVEEEVEQGVQVELEPGLLASRGEGGVVEGERL